MRNMIHTICVQAPDGVENEARYWIGKKLLTLAFWLLKWKVA